MEYIYINKLPEKQEKEWVDQYIEDNSRLRSISKIEENDSIKVNIKCRSIWKEMAKLKRGDVITIFSPAYSFVSNKQFLDFVYRCLSLCITFRCSFGEISISTMPMDIINIVNMANSSLISKKVYLFLEKRKELGLKTGRPFGLRNKSLKLDSKEEDIKKYLKIGITKASISKIIGCHPKTLTSWMGEKLEKDFVGQ